MVRSSEGYPLPAPARGSRGAARWPDPVGPWRRSTRPRPPGTRRSARRLSGPAPPCPIVGARAVRTVPGGRRRRPANTSLGRDSRTRRAKAAASSRFNPWCRTCASTVRGARATERHRPVRAQLLVDLLPTPGDSSLESCTQDPGNSLSFALGRRNPPTTSGPIRLPRPAHQSLRTRSDDADGISCVPRPELPPERNRPLHDKLDRPAVAHRWPPPTPVGHEPLSPTPVRPDLGRVVGVPQRGRCLGRNRYGSTYHVASGSLLHGSRTGRTMASSTPGPPAPTPVPAGSSSPPTPSWVWISPAPSTGPATAGASGSPLVGLVAFFVVVRLLATFLFAGVVLPAPPPVRPTPLLRRRGQHPHRKRVRLLAEHGRIRGRLRNGSARLRGGCGRNGLLRGHSDLRGLLRAHHGPGRIRADEPGGASVPFASVVLLDCGRRGYRAVCWVGFPGTGPPVPRPRAAWPRRRLNRPPCRSPCPPPRRSCSRSAQRTGVLPSWGTSSRPTEWARFRARSPVPPWKWPPHRTGPFRSCGELEFA